MVLECGAARPERAEPPFEVGPPDRAKLLALTTRDVGAGTRFTTSESAVTVAVTVPDGYAAGELLVPLSGPMLELLPAPSPAPGG